ncbi:MAG: hypothetical protein P8019_15810 [Gammaproteobacteria bacterium]
MKTKQPSVYNKFRHAAMGVVLASSVIVAVPAQASWFGHVSSREHKVAHRVAATPGNLEAKVRDMSGKLNDIYQKFENGMPIVQKMQQIHLKEKLMNNIDYLRDTMSDYDDFANGGAENFRGDLESIFDNFSSFNQAILHKQALSNSLDRVNQLVGKLPVSFLYILHKAIGTQLQNMQTKVVLMNSNAQVLASLPSVSTAMQDPQSFIDNACDQDQHKGLKTSFRLALAVIKITAGQIELWADHYEKLAPRDLVLEGDAVGEGAGTTVSSHPAHIILEELKFPAKVTKEVVEDYKTLAEALCK